MKVQRPTDEGGKEMGMKVAVNVHFEASQMGDVDRDFVLMQLPMHHDNGETNQPSSQPVSSPEDFIDGPFLGGLYSNASQI